MGYAPVPLLKFAQMLTALIDLSSLFIPALSYFYLTGHFRSLSACLMALIVVWPY